MEEQDGKRGVMGRVTKKGQLVQDHSEDRLSLSVEKRCRKESWHMHILKGSCLTAVMKTDELGQG